MQHATWVLGYHGCDKTTGEAILAGKLEIEPSVNDYDWLGTGAYFWENSYSRAFAWARFLRDNPGFSKSEVKVPFVVGAIIDPGNCLDLTEDGSLRVLKGTYNIFKGVFEILDKKLPENEGGFKTDKDLVKRKLDCAVINFLHTMRRKTGLPPFHTVRAPFMEGDYLFEGSRFHAKTHIQWCVRNPKRSIRAYFRPRRTGLLLSKRGKEV
jgi:hypothetical protein